MQTVLLTPCRVPAFIQAVLWPLYAMTAFADAHAPKPSQVPGGPDGLSPARTCSPKPSPASDGMDGHAPARASTSMLRHPSARKPRHACIFNL